MRISLKCKLIPLLLLFFAQSIVAQTDCVKSLQEAQKLYEQGMIDDIPELLKPCIESGFTRNQKIEAYKLLIITYLFDGDQLKAEETIIEFLKKNPEYELMPNDPVEFTYLFESFHSLSVNSIGLNFGPNFTNPRVIQPFTSGDVTNSELTNSTSTGFQIGLGGIRYIAKNVFLNLEVNYIRSNYQFTEKSYTWATETKSLSSSIEFKESVNQIEVPVSIGYEIESDLFNYYLRTGLSFNSVSKVLGSPKLIFDENQSPKSLSEIDISEHRKKTYFGLLFGAGLKYKIPRGYLVADFRMNLGLNNMMLKENRFSNTDMWENYTYVDDDFSLKRFSFTVGYYFSIYQPKKNQ